MEDTANNPQPYVAAGDIVVLRPVLAFHEVYHLALVLSRERRFGRYGYGCPRVTDLLAVRYLDTDTLEKEREFTAHRLESTPDYKPLQDAFIDVAYVTDVISRGNPHPEAPNLNRPCRVAIPSRNRMSGSPYQLVHHVMLTSGPKVETGIDEEKAAKLFHKHRGEFVVAQDSHGDAFGYKVYGNHYTVNTKKFRRWVLRNAMKFVTTAQKLHRECTEGYEIESREMDWDRRDDEDQLPYVDAEDNDFDTIDWGEASFSHIESIGRLKLGTEVPNGQGDRYVAELVNSLDEQTTQEALL